MHKLHEQHIALLRKIAVQFVKSDILERQNIWEIDYSDTTIFLAPNRINIGQDAESLMTNRDGPDTHLLYRVRGCYLFSIKL